MTARFVALVLVGGVCLTLAACSGGRTVGPRPDPTGRVADEAEPELPLPPPPPRTQRAVGEDIDDQGYADLKCGGSMYAGTVLSIKVEGNVDRGETPCEWGQLRFRVARTIAGRPRKEITIRFMWFESFDDRPDAGPTLMADWADTYSPWPARPRPGERLLLLLGDEKLAESIYGKLRGAVFHRWAVSPDDPLVDGFALAARFLAVGDGPKRDDLYRQLCQSRFQNMRLFARDAAFAYLGWEKGDVDYHYLATGQGYDPARQSHLALLFLKYAGLRLGTEERMGVTHAFGFWFANGDRLRGVTNELKAAFEDWYLIELSVRDDLRRPTKALKELEEVTEALGSETTVGLFKKSGRAGLLDRLRDCARSGDPDVEKLSKALLAKLAAP